MSPTPRLDEFLAKEGWYEVEGAEGARAQPVGSSVDRVVAPAPSSSHACPPGEVIYVVANPCDHEVRDLISICRSCGDGIELEADHRA